MEKNDRADRSGQAYFVRAVTDDHSPAFYQLVSIQAIENTRGNYQRVSTTMTKARNDGRVGFEDIVDRSRPEYSCTAWEDPDDYAESIRRSYRKDYWELQPERVEVWVEKDAIIGSIKALTDELGVMVRVGRGFVSTTKVREMAEVIKSKRKPMTIFYLGDHDPSGCAIEADLAERIRSYGAKFTINRLAIFAADIRNFKLPPLRVKETDSRAGGFLKKYSDQCVELDALPPTELRRRIREAVEGKLDLGEWNRAVEVEKAELDSIRDVMSKWTEMMRVSSE